MTRWLAAAKGVSEAGTKPTKLTKPPKTGGRAGVSSVLSVLSEGAEVKSGGASAAAFKCDTADTAPPADPDARAFEHGTSAGGTPRTWTGRVVSLAEWRKLSNWQRHGPDGHMFCGCCRQWLPPETAQAHAEVIRDAWEVRKPSAGVSTIPENL